MRAPRSSTRSSSRAWLHYSEDLRDSADLVAVGGYGRGELHPQSDIDLLVLLDGATENNADEAIGRFLTFLWDIGLEVGHSVRTLDDCEAQARSDVTVLTTLMETRLLHGPGKLFAELPDRGSARIGCGTAPSSSDAKLDEQTARHARYHDTAYNLEPNVKGSPGGLRDIQMISWLARRHFGATRLEDLVQHKFLTEGQLRILVAGQAFLWRIRFGLHLLTGRREDRLLFDHQVKLAQMLGYEDASFTLAVEQLMQRYYRTVMELSRLNEMLLQLFEEAILLDKDEPAFPLGPRFQSRNGYLEVGRRSGVRARAVRAARDCSCCSSRTSICAASTRARSRSCSSTSGSSTRSSARTRAITGCSSTSCARRRASRTTLKRMNTLRRARALHAGIRPHRGPHAVRPVPCLHGRRAHAVRRREPAPVRAAAVTTTSSRAAAQIMQRLDETGGRVPRRACSTTSRRAAAAITRSSARVDAEAFCLEHGMSRYDARLVAWLVRIT